jgi:YVTN family beta-propeller protein
MKAMLWTSLAVLTFSAYAKAQANPTIFATVCCNEVGAVSIIGTSANAITSFFPNPAGTEPNSMVFSPDGSTAYLSDFTYRQIEVLDVASDQVTATISVSPQSLIQNVPLALTPDGTKLYAALSKSVAVISTSSNTLGRSIPVHSDAGGLAVTPNGKNLYITNYGQSGGTAVIDTATDTVIRVIQSPSNAGAIIITGSQAYLSAGGSVWVIDTQRGASPTMIPNVTGVVSLAASPDGQYVYAGVNNAIAVISTATNTQTGTVTVPGLVGDITALAVTPDSTTLYAIPEGVVVDSMSQPPNIVFAINLASLTVSAQIPVGDWPTSVTVTPNGTQAYVTNHGPSYNAVANGATDQVTALVETGGFPCCVALASNSGVVWVSNSGGTTVSAVNASTNAILATIPVVSQNETFFQVSDLVLSPDESTVYVSVFNNVVPSSYIAAISTSSYTVTQTSPSTGNGNDFYHGIAISADGTTLYTVSLSPVPGVLVMNASTLAITTTLPINAAYTAYNPANLALSPDGTQLYVTAYQVLPQAAVVYGIDLATQQSTSPVGIGECSEHLTFTPSGTQVWIPNSYDQQILVLDPATNTLLTPINLPGGPSQISFTQDGSTAYVAEGGDILCADTAATGIAQVNVSSQQVTGNIPVGLPTQGIVVY